MLSSLLSIHSAPGRVFAMALGLVAVTACQQQSDGSAQGAGAPPEVEVVTLSEQSVALSNELPGRAVAYRKAEVRPQVSGIIEKRLFEEGRSVEAGQQLYLIDPARYEAALANAEAQLQRARANLATTRAREKRFNNLLADKAVSQQEYDDAQLAFQQAQAEVAVSEAALTTAEIDLRYTQVRAPISGHIGASRVTEGALVSAGQAQVLATIHQLDPIYVDVAQPSRRILEMRRQIMSGKLSESEAPTVELILADGSVYEHAGKLQFADMSVDQSTGSVEVRVLFPNPEKLIMPGMFVRAEIDEGVRDNAVLVPQRAVSRDREGNATTLVVNAESKVERRSLRVSRSVGSDWLVEEGLSAGERVIVAGLQKVQPGAQVTVVDADSAQGE